MDRKCIEDGRKGGVNMPEFKVGDVVGLKSGGPFMTIREVSKGPDDVYKCQWFDGNTLQEGSFAGSMLRRRPDSPPTIRSPR
jgi:uncharacterized protein YodC (DUF2158 family)